MPFRLQRLLLASPLVLLSAETAGQEFGPHLTYGVDRPSGTAQTTRLHADFQHNIGWIYGGVKGALAENATSSGTYDLYLGLNPEVGALAIDLKVREHHTDAGDRTSFIALEFNAPLSRHLHLKGHFELDAHTGSGSGNANAAWLIGEADRIEATVREAISAGTVQTNAYEIKATHAFEERGTISMLYKVPLGDANRIGLDYKVRF